MHNYNYGLIMSNEGKEIIKKLDSDRVLEGILNKMSSMKSMASGTEANDVLSGISEITKTALSPIKMVTSALSDFRKNAIEFDEKKKAEKKNKENKPAENGFPADIAKDSSVIDLQKQLEDLIQSNNRDLVDLQVISGNSKFLLEDMQKTIGLLVYGQEAVEKQLKSNQQNTKVFQVSKKELTAFEKEQLKLQDRSNERLSVLGQIKEQLIGLDESLTTDLVEAITNEEYGTHESNEEKLDADFPKENENKEDKKESDEKTFKEKSLEKLGKVWDSIKILGKYSWHLIKLATVTAAVAAAQLAIIGAIVIGIDLLQAWLSTKFGSMSEFGDYIGKKIELGLQWVAEKFILEPLDRLGLILDLIDIGITSLERTLILKLADVVEAFGPDEWADAMRKGANDNYNAKVEKLRFNEKAYREQHGQALFEKAAGKLIGNDKFQVDYGNMFKTTDEMNAEARKDIDQKSEENKNQDNVSLNKELANGMTIPLNASLEQLQTINEQLKLDRSEKSQQSREQLEALMKIKERRDEQINTKVQEKTGTWEFADWWYEFRDWAQGTNLAEERKKAREIARIEATKDVDNKLKISEVTADTAKQKAQQIKQEEMMEYGTYNPLNMEIKGIREQMAEQQRNQNNTQVNTQNNTTNVFQQPMSVQNPRQPGTQTRTNIGTN